MREQPDDAMVADARLGMTMEQQQDLRDRYHNYT
jgi:hypothetical protein